MKPFFTAVATFNACAWPWIFAAYALWTRDYYHVCTYVAAGAVFGGAMLLLLAVLLVGLKTWFGDKPFAKRIAEAALPPAKLAGAALILFALGGTGLFFEQFRYRPSWERKATIRVWNHWNSRLPCLIITGNLFVCIKS